ncbi:hypothetical protein Peur_040489 [Populus x canadensis]
MSKLLARIAGYLSNRTMVGVDKVGNRYFTRTEEIDGIMKEKRCVIFKGEGDPTSLSVEWICWLNGQRKRAPTPEEQMELEARRELVKQNVALLKQEEEERRAKEGSSHKAKSTGKTGGPDLKSFIHQFPTEVTLIHLLLKYFFCRHSEPTGSGSTFKPGTWQPPT